MGSIGDTKEIRIEGETGRLNRKARTGKKSNSRRSGRTGRVNNARGGKKASALRKWILIGGIVIASGCAILLMVFAVLIFRHKGGTVPMPTFHGPRSTEVSAMQPDFDVQLLDVNPYSRPGDKTEKITGIVIHYTANPGSSAQANRDYFNSLKDTHKTEASSNFVVGLEGEIIQCVPTWEVAYASNKRNIDTVSIECCHPDESGWFNDATYESLVQLTAWLCTKFDLTTEDVIRHYDVTGKNCPKYFVENEDAWEEFLRNVDDALQRGTGNGAG